MAIKPNNLENSSIEQLWALNQQFNNIFVILVVALPYVWFPTSMTFCVLSSLINS
jgi:hypothetical protein